MGTVTEIIISVASVGALVAVGWYNVTHPTQWGGGWEDVPCREPAASDDA